MPGIKLPELRGKEKVGLYFIGIYDNLFLKIGTSISLAKRLNSYHICVPNGFNIFALLILKDSVLPETKKDKYKFIYKIEKQYIKFIENIISKEARYNTRKRKFLQEDDLIEIGKERMIKFAKKIKHLVANCYTNFKPVSPDMYDIDGLTGKQVRKIRGEVDHDINLNNLSSQIEEGHLESTDNKKKKSGINKNV